MENNVHTLRSIEDEASEWIAALERGCSAEQRRRLDAWLGADPERRAVFEEMNRHWQTLGRTAETVGRLGRPRPASGRSRYWKTGGAAVAAALLAALAFGLMNLRSGVSNLPQLYATEVGAQRTLSLDDGSSIELNTATRVEVEFDRDRRLVRLAAGEALFHVAPDASRPFVVIAGSNVVQALGTAFVVRVDSDRTRVVVTEGKVVVRSLDSSGSASDLTAPVGTPVSAGEGLALGERPGSVARVDPARLKRSLAWRRGILNVQDEPLGEVIGEVERYSLTRIAIADPALADIRVGGYFKATDVEAFLTLLEGQFPIRAERVTPGQVILRKRAAGE